MGEAQDSQGSSFQKVEDSAQETSKQRKFGGDLIKARINLGDPPEADWKICKQSFNFPCSVSLNVGGEPASEGTW